ncbi:MAG: SCO family protein [Betaproteobacteria bacterium]
MLALLTACARQPAPLNNTDITGAEFGRQLSLPDQTGTPRSLTDYKGKAVVLFFGYTTCPDVCPTTLARFAEVMKRLGEDAGKVQVLFVTLDPARDTPEKLATYLAWFNPGFVGLRGDAAATEAAAREFKVFYAKKDVGGGMGYVIDHTSGAYVYDPAGRLRLFVKDGTPVEAIVADLRALVSGR